MGVVCGWLGDGKGKGKDNLGGPFGRAGDTTPQLDFHLCTAAQLMDLLITSLMVPCLVCPPICVVQYCMPSPFSFMNHHFLFNFILSGSPCLFHFFSSCEAKERIRKSDMI